MSVRKITEKNSLIWKIMIITLKNKYAHKSIKITRTVCPHQDGVNSYAPKLAC